MVKLIVSRYHQKRESEHPTFQQAAIAAIGEFENGLSFPLEILHDNGRMLWRQDGPVDSAIDFLRTVARKEMKPAAQGGFIGEDMARHPMQPLVEDEQGTLRFKKNKIVRFLLDAGPFDLGQLALMPFDDEDREQFAQLIGYSLSGFGGLDYVSDETLVSGLGQAALASEV